jgi:hypothetical protein
MNNHSCALVTCLFKDFVFQFARLCRPIQPKAMTDIQMLNLIQHKMERNQNEKSEILQMEKTVIKIQA